MRKGVWMRIYDVAGIEQSAVMVLDDYTFWLHSVEDDRPMLIDWDYEPGKGARNAFDVCELARKTRQSATDSQFAAGGTQLLKAGV